MPVRSMVASRIPVAFCLGGLALAAWPGTVEGQNRNWVPARQLRAVEQWRKGQAGGDKKTTVEEPRSPGEQPILRIEPEEEENESQEQKSDKVAAGKLKKKTSTTQISDDKVTPETGPLLLPPTPMQLERPTPVESPQKVETKKNQRPAPSTKIETEAAPKKVETTRTPAKVRKVVPAEIPELDAIPLETYEIKAPNSVIQQPAPRSSGAAKTPSQERAATTAVPGTKVVPFEPESVAPQSVRSAPTPTKSPVTILQPIPEGVNSPVRTSTPQNMQPQSVLRPLPRIAPQPLFQTRSTYQTHPMPSPTPIQGGTPEGGKSPITTKTMLPSPATPSTVVPIAATETGGDHWIVSARRCDEMELANGCRNCLEFFHGDGTTPLQRSGWDPFFSTLQPNTPVSFFIHGSFISWQGVTVEAHETSRWIRNAAPNQPVRVVYFTWPSDSNIPHLLPIDVNVLGQRSSNYGFHLAYLIGQIPKDQPVTLVGHSHGARLASSTMHLLAGGSIDGEQLPANLVGQRKIRMVLASAALDRNWLNPGQMYERALVLPEAVLNMRNSSDYALNAYPLVKPFGVDSLGLTGPKPQDREELGPLNGKLVDLELSTILGNTHTWPNYYSEPELAQVMAPYVFHQPLASNAKSSSVSIGKGTTVQSVSGPKAIPVDVMPVRKMGPGK